MKDNFAKAFGIGLAAVVVIVGAIMFMQRGAHIDLTGSIKVRTVPAAEHESLVLVDLHLTNPADYAFEVHNVTVILQNKGGDYPQPIASKSDTLRLFDSMAANGPFHPTLYTNAPIPAHSTGDYTVVASYSAPESVLKDRKQFVVRLEEINGKTVEFSEKGPDSGR